VAVDSGAGKEGDELDGSFEFTLCRVVSTHAAAPSGSNPDAPPTTSNSRKTGLEYSLFANSVYGVIAKSLDIYALAKLLLEERRRPFAEVAKEIGMSASEFHAAVKRLAVSGLIDQESRKPHCKPTEEFLFHGVPYIFPATPGSLIRGVPTSYGAAPLNALIASSSGAVIPVWPDAEGKSRGYSIEPLHPSAPKAARTDAAFYELLALIDALRDGRMRERQMAREELHRRIFFR
jgi:hypothetical protein